MSCRQVYARISYIRQRGLVKLVSGGLAGLAHKCRTATVTFRSGAFDSEAFSSIAGISNRVFTRAPPVIADSYSSRQPFCVTTITATSRR
jgi:hypothetical protein